MKRTYWEKIAPAYEEEIFDVLQSDKKALIRAAIKKFAARSKTVIDIGCAVGKWIPVLAPAFKKVFAVDISARNLTIAKNKYPQYRNVEYLRADMSAKKSKFPRCDLAICINAILTSSLKDRKIFFHALPSCLKKGGHLILVVPSLESYMLTAIVSNQWNIDKALLNKKTPGKAAMKKWINIRQGNAHIDDVPTKHYLEEELHLLLSREGFAVIECRKIEYDWNTEFLKPPKWLNEPRPWDWMCVAKKL